MKKTYYITLISAIALGSCKSGTHKETLLVAKDYPLPDAIAAKLKDVPTNTITDSLMYENAFVRIKASYKSKDAASVITRLEIYKAETDKIAIKGNVSSTPINMGTTEFPLARLEGNILFEKTEVGKISITGRAFDVLGSGKIVKKG